MVRGALLIHLIRALNAKQDVLSIDERVPRICSSAVGRGMAGNIYCLLEWQVVIDQFPPPGGISPSGNRGLLLLLLLLLFAGVQ